MAGDDCQQALRDLQAFLDHECDGDLEEVIARHLMDCPPCFDRAEFERQLRAVVATSCKDAAPPGLIDRVRSRLQAG